MTPGPTDAPSGAGVVAINHDAREAVDRALANARLSAYPPGEYVGQESFMRATEIVRLAERAGIGPDTSVLDLCCGVAGPGLLITSTFDCSYHGVDASASAVRIAEARAGALNCHFEVARVPPLPAGEFDVVLLFETMLAFPDKHDLLQHIGAALPQGGRFVFTVEEGEPLSDLERTTMPESNTVWLTPLAELQSQLSAAGFRVSWHEDSSQAHQEIAQRLCHELSSEAADIRGQLGAKAFDSLLAAHQLWSDWLRTGRVRKFAIVAQRT